MGTVWLDIAGGGAIEADGGGLIEPDEDQSDPKDVKDCSELFDRRNTPLFLEDNIIFSLSSLFLRLVVLCFVGRRLDAVDRGMENRILRLYFVEA
jgi:hypothetical protein